MKAYPSLPAETDPSEFFFLAIPWADYMNLMEKAREKQTTVAILLRDALKIALS